MRTNVRMLRSALFRHKLVFVRRGLDYINESLDVLPRSMMRNFLRSEGGFHGEGQIVG